MTSTATISSDWWPLSISPTVLLPVPSVLPFFCSYVSLSLPISLSLSLYVCVCGLLLLATLRRRPLGRSQRRVKFIMTSAFHCVWQRLVVPACKLELFRRITAAEYTGWLKTSGHRPVEPAALHAAAKKYYLLHRTGSTTGGARILGSTPAGVDR